MDIVKELTRLHELAGETTVLNFRALMQNELRKLIEQAQEEAAQQSVHLTATPEPVCTCKVTAESYKNCDAHGNRRR